MAGVAKLVTAMDCDSIIRGFKSRHSPLEKTTSKFLPSCVLLDSSGKFWFRRFYPFSCSRLVEASTEKI